MHYTQKSLNKLWDNVCNRVYKKDFIKTIAGFIPLHQIETTFSIKASTIQGYISTGKKN